MAAKNITRIIAKKLLKANRIRNTFAILGIVLTTILFTSIFTISMSLIASMQETLNRQIGIAANGEIKYITMEQYNQIKEHDLIKDIGCSRIIAKVTNEAISSYNAELRSASNDWVANVCYAEPTHGRLPEKRDEVALDTIMLDFLGVPHNLGENVTIEYKLGKTSITETFVLSGYWEEDGLKPASLVWVSNIYADEILQDYQPLYENDYVGTWNALINFYKGNNLEDQFQKVIQDSGYSLDEIRYGVNASNISVDRLDYRVILLIVMIITMIILCGYLIISNIFSISIIKDIHIYALFKMIGSDLKQLNLYVMYQAFYLCLIGIPVGIFAGYMIGVILVPYILESLNVTATHMSANPLIFVGAAAFSYITVLISSYKSKKIVQQVSPISAIRSTEGDIKNLQRTQKSILNKGKGNILKIAYANVFRGKKKSINVIISLAFSLILLNISCSSAANYDLDKYIAQYISCDFIISDTDYLNGHGLFENRGVINSETIFRISSIEGVEEFANVYFKELTYRDDTLKSKYSELLEDAQTSAYTRAALEKCVEEETIQAHLYGIDEMVFQNISIYLGEFEPILFQTGDYVLVSAVEATGDTYAFAPGDMVTIQNDAGLNKEYEVMAIAELPYSLGVRHSHLVTPEFILPSQEYMNHQDDFVPMLCMMNVTDELEVDAAKNLDKLCKDNVLLDYVSRNSYREKFNNEKQMFLIVGGMLSLILGAIGITNYMNSMVTSIMMRRRELALLQSIGMTSGQINLMLVFEGAIYIGYTYIVVMTIGTLINRLIMNMLGSIFWYMNTENSVMASMLCFPILFVFAVMIPYICINIMRKKGLIERLCFLE